MKLTHTDLVLNGRWLRKLSAFLFRGRAEREMEREITAHLALIEDDFRRRGLSPADARLAARRAWGGVEQTRELHRHERSVVWMEQAWQDLRHAARGLMRSPGFTAVALATLALGIGVNTTLFTAYNAVALKPLPVAAPGSVVRVERWFQSGNQGDIQYAFSYAEYRFARERLTAISSLMASTWQINVSLSEGGDEQKLQGQLVSPNYFAGLGIRATLGRMFLPGEDRAPVVVLSHAFWQRHFEGDAGVRGKTLRLNGALVTIVGVAEEPFTGTSVAPQLPDFWAPLAMQPQLVPGADWLTNPGARRLQLIGRLAAGATLHGAQAEAAVVFRQAAAESDPKDPTVAITLQHPSLFGNTEDVRFQALAAGLMFIVALVLVVACANLANMLLARGAARQREIGLRLALGAGRARVIRHLLTESLLLALAGGAAGLVLSTWTSRILWLSIQRLIAVPLGLSTTVPVNLSPDIRVFGYALAVSAITGVLFGLSPALRSTRSGILAALKDDGPRRPRLRRWLVACEVAVSMLLLVTAGFLARGLLRSHAVDAGFETRGTFLLLADFGGPAGHPASLRQRLIDRLSSVREVRRVASGTIPMLGTWTPPIVVGNVTGRTLASYASEGYFETLGIPLVRGRGFNAREAEEGAQTAVISEAAARRWWPGDDPIGRRFALDMDFRGTLREFEVVGIARDVRFANLTRTDPAHVYLPTKAAASEPILFRAAGDPRAVTPAVRAAIAAVDRALLPGLVLSSIENGPMQLQKTMADGVARFAGILAALALVLAGIGIYGVMAFLVAQRVKEIGVRMALGATAGGVLRAVVLEGLRPVFTGILFGLAAAAALSWQLHRTLVFPGSADFFYGVPFYDPPTFLALAAFVLAIAACASAAPARRAVRVDPVVALRHE